MAIICRDHRLLFIMAPRTGCTALGRLLKERLGAENLPAQALLNEDGSYRLEGKHATLRQLLSHGLLNPEERRALFVFTCVRNPFDSLVSLYMKKADHYQPLLADPSTWVHRVPGYAKDMEYCRTHTFEQWITKKYSVSALDRLLGRRKRSLAAPFTEGVDFVMRFEQLNEDFHQVLQRAGITHRIDIPLYNATPSRDRDYRTYYTPRARRAVEYTFEPDLRRYSYSFDGPVAVAEGSR